MALLKVVEEDVIKGDTDLHANKHDDDPLQRVALLILQNLHVEFGLYAVRPATQNNLEPNEPM